MIAFDSFNQVESDRWYHRTEATPPQSEYVLTCKDGRPGVGVYWGTVQGWVINGSRANRTDYWRKLPEMPQKIAHP